tara:strand:+ start:141023 stop:141256 length:234 start_codon:yes stop_codon:yes gene_type:complete
MRALPAGVRLPDSHQLASLTAAPKQLGTAGRHHLGRVRFCFSHVSHFPLQTQTPGTHQAWNIGLDLADGQGQVPNSD